MASTMPSLIIADDRNLQVKYDRGNDMFVIRSGTPGRNIYLTHEGVRDLIAYLTNAWRAHPLEKEDDK